MGWPRWGHRPGARTPRAPGARWLGTRSGRCCWWWPSPPQPAPPQHHGWPGQLEAGGQGLLSPPSISQPLSLTQHLQLVVHAVPACLVGCLARVPARVLLPHRRQLQHPAPCGTGWGQGGESPVVGVPSTIPLPPCCAWPPRSPGDASWVPRVLRVLAGARGQDPTPPVLGMLWWQGHYLAGSAPRGRGRGAPRPCTR